MKQVGQKMKNRLNNSKLIQRIKGIIGIYKLNLKFDKRNSFYFKEKDLVIFIKVQFQVVIRLLFLQSEVTSVFKQISNKNMSAEKVQSDNINPIRRFVSKQEQKAQVHQQSQLQLQKNLSQSYIRQQQKSQNPKIGRPAKTDQEQQFKKCYMQNKQKFQLECELLVFIHQNYFDQIIDNPINIRVSKDFMDRLFVANHCEEVYKTLLKLNENYFKNSSYYPQEKLKYTSLIDVAYMCNTVRQNHGQKMSSLQLLLIIFFFLYNQKLVNQNFYEYFVKNIQKFRDGMIFGPGGKNAPKLQKLDKLIICLALTLAQLQKILIEEEVLYSEEEYSESESEHEQDGDVKNVYVSKGNNEQDEIDDSSRPKKRFHEDR